MKNIDIITVCDLELELLSIFFFYFIWTGVMGISNSFNGSKLLLNAKIPEVSDAEFLQVHRYAV
jgi:hypothetical protein